MALVVLLRGVNVGGHKTFRPARLVEELKHLDAVNIGAAGTFVVRRPVSQTKLRSEIARRLPFEAEIMICEGRDVTRLVTRDFFPGQADKPDVTRFVSLLARLPRPAPRVPFQLPTDGAWQLKVLSREGRFVIGMYRRDMKAVGNLGALDKIFGTPVTTRNWNTIVTIAKVLDDRARSAKG